MPTQLLPSRGAGAPAVTTEETGTDIFRRQPDGRWRIARFIAYD